MSLRGERISILSHLSTSVQSLVKSQSQNRDLIILKTTQKYLKKDAGDGGGREEIGHPKIYFFDIELS